MSTEPKENEENVWFRRFQSVGVLVTCFLGMAFSVGVSSGTSVLIVEFIEYFRQSRFVISWCSSIALALNLITGPIWMIALRKVTYRRMFVIGVVVCTLGLFASSFATSVYQLYLTLGLIAGLGYGILDYTSIVYAGEYFTTRRYLAMGIVSSGAGVGNVLVPLLFVVFTDIYTWRGGLIIIAGILLELAVLSFFIKIVNKTDQIKNESDIGEVGRTNKKAIMEMINFARTNLKNIVESTISCSATPHSEDVTDKSQNNISLCENIDKTAARRVSELEIKIENHMRDLELGTIKQNVVSLLKRWQFYCYAISFLLFGICISIVMTFNMDYFISVGIRRSDAIILVLLAGMGNTCGRVGTGILSHYFAKRGTMFLIAGNMLFALSTVLIAQYTDFYLNAVLLFVIGLSYGCVAASAVIVSVQLFGAARVREGVAIIFLTFGLGMLFGPPIGGMVYDMTQDYRVVFTMCTGVSVMAGAFIIPIFCASLALNKRLC